jgi:Nucleotidyl transferase AbiEii toxin, Type IV TA system
VKSITPRLETLPEAQRELWPRLSALGADYVLYGGTALSLQVGGRTSIDFDFFSSNTLVHEQLIKRLPFLNNARLRLRSVDTEIFSVEVSNCEISISFFGGLRIGRVSDPVRFSDNGIFAAGLLDIAATKVSVIQQRAEAKDYKDIHTLLSNGLSLEMALGAAKALYPAFNAAISLKALSYFGDVHGLPPNIQSDLSIAAAQVRELLEISRRNDSLLPDFGSIERDREPLGEHVELREIKPSEPELEM